MNYIDGFVFAVPTANKGGFIESARHFDTMLMEQGALRVVECWGDNVPHGKLTDFYGAVKANDDETVVFSWVEWPDKATRDAAHAMIEDKMKDGAFDPGEQPMPFDGSRMIFGSFVPVFELGGV